MGLGPSGVERLREQPANQGQPCASVRPSQTIASDTAKIASHSSSIARRGTRLLQRRGHGCQLRARQRLLDEHEQLAFLQPDVIGEHGTEVVQRRDVSRCVAGKLVEPLPDGDVVA
jgi:hypothetical protein